MGGTLMAPPSLALLHKGGGDLILQQLARKTGEALKKRGLKLATAESCTGGGLAYWITSIPGSSDWFDRGFVTYSDASKTEILGVNPATIDTFGAVSEQTVREMAEGALHKSGAGMSIAITGIAGPTGGTTEKPVGTVWIAWSSEDFETKTHWELFSGNRIEIREKVIERALEKLLVLLPRQH